MSPGPESCGWARFDDLRSGIGLRCPPAYRVLVARRPDEVVPVLAEVERATGAGAWAFGYVAYEAAPGLDPHLPVVDPGPGRTDEDLPLAWFGLCSEPERVPVIAPPPGRSRDYDAAPWVPGWTPEGYREAVAGIREHLAAGDTYQTNLTVRLRSTVTGDLEQLYADLACGQQGAHNAYLDLGRHAIASASPELFFSWSGDRVLTRPMKGTAPRGRTSAEDQDRARLLRESPKERAENTMIVDLLRNDVARVADVGSVRVPRLCGLERYETVWQLTSDVTGTARPGTGLVDLFRALFPSGSVTGAPKERTMGIIADTEREPRGVYCGAVGLVGPPGAPDRARFSVAIRTAVVDRTAGAAIYGTGGGITWASDPEAERAELGVKAAILAEPYEEFGLIETLAYVPGSGPRNLDRHLARLADSAAYFGFGLDLARVRGEIEACVSGRVAPARVRVLLARSGAVTVEIGPLPEGTGDPVSLAVDFDPVDSSQRWLYHKTTRREVYATRAARHPDADDVVLVNERGEITETTIASLAVRLDGSWWTPPVTSGCLPGIERGRLLDAGRLAERAMTPEDLHRAEGLAVVSSLRGWRPAGLSGPRGCGDVD